MGVPVKNIMDSMTMVAVDLLVTQ